MNAKAKMANKNLKNEDIRDYLFGKEKVELIKYVLKKKNFYQAEAAKDLHWSVSKAQYHLYQFVKHNLLFEKPTSVRTYYRPNIKLLHKYD